MPTNFVSVEYDSLLLFPTDFRQWLPAELMRIICRICQASLAMDRAVVHIRGSGRPKCPPRLMLALLRYGHLTNRTGSHAIERAYFDDLGVPFLFAQTHPDHDTLAQVPGHSILG